MEARDLGMHLWKLKNGYVTDGAILAKKFGSNTVIVKTLEQIKLIELENQERQCK